MCTPLFTYFLHVISRCFRPLSTVLTWDQLEELFNDQTGYLSKVDEVFNIAERTSSKVIADRKLLVLDVDNTLIYVRHFMDEMRVGDVVELGENEAIVTQLTYKLDLEFSETPGEMTSCDHVLENKDDPLPQRGEWFPDEEQKVAMIHKADPTESVVKLIVDDTIDQQRDISSDQESNKLVTISFLRNSDELSQLEPMMHRANYLPVDFMYGGYLVRIRPGLAQFLHRCNARYDVTLFTAAVGSVYKGLLHSVHHILCRKLPERGKEWRCSELLVSGFLRQFEDMMIPHEIAAEILHWFGRWRKLWQKIYYRKDCDEKVDEYGLPYRHKNIAKLGWDLSKIVVVDDNPLSYRGFEPNTVRVAGFWGLSNPPDNELMSVLFPILQTVRHHDDVRYHLTGLGQPPLETDHENDSDSYSDLLETEVTEQSGMF